MNNAKIISIVKIFYMSPYYVDKTLKPICPRCGTTEGALGTSNAYFMCKHCKREDGRGNMEAYYIYADNNYPYRTMLNLKWETRIKASPWGKN